jgi:hypothetical protein
MGLGVVVHAFNTSYTGGRDQEDSSRAVQAKSERDSILTNKLGVVARACDPSYAGSVGRRITVGGWLRQKWEKISEK